MTNGMGDAPDRVHGIEQRIDALAAAVSTRFDHIDWRFDQVDRRFEQVDRRFEQVDRRFEQVDRRFEEVERRFEQVDAAILEQREYTEFAYLRLDAKMDAGFGRLERKIDQILDLVIRQSRKHGSDSER